MKKTKFDIVINILNSRANNHKWVMPNVNEIEELKKLLKIVGENPTTYAMNWDRTDHNEISQTYSIYAGVEENEIATVTFQWMTYTEAQEIMGSVMDIF